MKTNLKQWLDWQNTLHTSKIELSLTRVKTVAKRLNLLEATFPIITVAGTNGKGSSVALLDAMLTANDMRVGRYTSPHLLSYNERICIAGNNATDEQICHAFAIIEKVRKEISLTFFEFATLAAMILFKQHKVDISILEVGLGGRLDAVNIFNADIALVTSIDIDHSDWLGNDRETIGFEKAGIFRTNQLAVCSDLNPPQSVVKHAKKLATKLHCFPHDFNYHKTENGWIWQTNDKTIKLPNLNLYGDFQLQNAAGVLMVLELLQLPIIADGLLNTNIAGRFQVLSGPITRIFDVAHNPLGAKVLSTTLQQFAGDRPVHAVFGMLNKKDVTGFVKLIQNNITSWHIAPLNTPQTTTVQALNNSLISNGIKKITSYSSISNAYNNLLKNTKDGEIILITGSFHTVAEIVESNTVSYPPY